MYLFILIVCHHTIILILYRFIYDTYWLSKILPSLQGFTTDGTDGYVIWIRFFFRAFIVSLQNFYSADGFFTEGNLYIEYYFITRGFFEHIKEFCILKSWALSQGSDLTLIFDILDYDFELFFLLLFNKESKLLVELWGEVH